MSEVAQHIDVHDLTDNEIIQMLRSVKNMSNSIYLTNQNITDKKMEKYLLFYTPQFTSPIILQSITELYLDNNNICCGFTILFNILHLKLIKILSLCSNNLDDEGAIVLAKYLNNHSNWLEKLEYLDISKNCIGYEGTRAIAESLKTHKHLYDLDMSDNNISSRGANYIGDMLHMNKSIRYLNINDNNIKMHEAMPFAINISMNTSLHTLNLGCNDFEDDGADADDGADNDAANDNAAADADDNAVAANDNAAAAAAADVNLDAAEYHVQMTSLSEVITLILSSQSINNLVFDVCDIDDIKTQYIANGLKQNNTLQELYLGCNQISNEGAYLLFDALKYNDLTILKHLDISNNNIDNECIGSFAELVGGNNVLQTISMYYTYIDNEGLIELSTKPELILNDSLIKLTFGQGDVDDVIPIKNDVITSILERNLHLYWNPSYYNTEIFGSSDDAYNIHEIIMATLLCNTYGNLQVRLPIQVLIYIFKFFNRSKFVYIDE